MESEISALRPPLMMQCSFFVHPPGHKIGLYDCEKFARFGMDANRPHEVAEEGRGEERERERRKEEEEALSACPQQKKNHYERQSRKSMSEQELYFEL